MMENYNFNDGGAFAEIHVPQFPFGNSESGTAAAKGSTTSRAIAIRPTAAASSLVPHYFSAQELARQSAEEVEENVDRTKHLLQVALASREAPDAINDVRKATVLEYKPQLGVSRTIEIIDTPRDPLDPSRVKVKRLGRQPTGRGDPAPIVRSPTKKPQASPAAGGGSVGPPPLLSIPPCVQNWTNPRNLAISIEHREAADGRNYISNKMGDTHFALADALAESERSLAAARAARKAALDEEVEEKQLQEEEDMVRRAQEALQKDAQRRGEERARHRNETPDQRQERIAEEQQARDRAREEERKQRRLEKTAQKLGLTKEEAEAHRDELLDIVNTRAANDSLTVETIGGARHQLQRGAMEGEAEGLYDEPLFAKRRAAFRVDSDNIEAEMRRQQQQQEQGSRHSTKPPASAGQGAAPTAVKSSTFLSDPGDEDVFGVSDLLTNRKRQRDK